MPVQGASSPRRSAAEHAAQQVHCRYIPYNPAPALPPPAFHIVAHGADAAHDCAVQGGISVKCKGALHSGGVDEQCIGDCSVCTELPGLLGCAPSTSRW